MGYAWNGVCYQDTFSALDAFAQQVPASSGQAINAFVSYPSISGSGLITWAIENRPLSDTVATFRTGTTQLLSCNSEGMSQWSSQSLLLILALIFAAFSGFRTGYRP